MKRKLAIIGFGGHGRVVADVATAIGCYEEIVFLDDVKPVTEITYRYMGTSAIAEELQMEYALFVAIGNSCIRQKIMDRYPNAEYPTLIHPSAIIGSHVSIGKGTVIMPGSIINTGTQIGKGVICNTASSVDHDCIVGDFCHISVGTHICGTVELGQHDWIGAGATIINNCSVCSQCTVGAGAVVVKNITESGIYIGVPARRCK